MELSLPNKWSYYSLDIMNPHMVPTAVDLQVFEAMHKWGMFYR